MSEKENENWKYLVGGSLIAASAFLGYYLWKRNKSQFPEIKDEFKETETKENQKGVEFKYKEILELYQKKCKIQNSTQFLSHHKLLSSKKRIDSIFESFGIQRNKRKRI
jgi:hypothetical protein